METCKILEVLYTALQLHRDGKNIITPKDVMAKNAGYFNKLSTEKDYDDMLYFLSVNHFFGKKWKNEKPIGYSFEMAHLNYLK